MNFSIRKGEKKDLPTLLQLIKELADYEKASNEVSITLEELEKDGFDDNPVYGFFVAETENKVAGIALYYLKYSTWKGKCIFLEDIIVTEKYRGLGLGKKLFEAVVNVSKKMKVKRMEWQVLNWNEPAIGFYKKFNSNFDSTWINCRLVDKQIQEFQFSEPTLDSSYQK